MVVTVTHAGYIKRTPLAEYRVQGRGGKGRAGMATRDEDFVTRLFVASTHTPVLFFSSRGMAYKLKVWRLPEARIAGRGKAMVNILPLEQGERITTILPLPEDERSGTSSMSIFATTIGRCAPQRAVRFRRGQQERQDRHEARRGRRHRRRADLHRADDVLLTTRGGKCIRFPVADVRVFKGRNSTGVRGIKLAEGDKVISLSILRHVDATAEERAPI